jgi:xylan 1,4-beta-xylosidase
MRFVIALVAFLLLAVTAVQAQPPRLAPRTWCNPLDLEYRYVFETIDAGASFRSGADPVIVNHQGEYYLFQTLAGGWWHSKDLARWEFVKPTLWPLVGIVAPAAVSYGDGIYFFPSTFERRPLFVTRDPKGGTVEYFHRLLPRVPGVEGRTDSPGPWDPDLFRDPDTGRWYMYFGSSNVYPLYGIELDWNRRLAYVGTPKELFYLDPENQGWHRFGQDHRDPLRPYVEGAAMTKHDGKYYLMYGAPGTEYNVYANGVAVGDDPLGPFVDAPYNPVSYKPGGFMAGAGHGNAFQDAFGNWWNTGTPWVAVNWRFERRVSMFPGGFDADGQMYANSRFGDFPHFVPTGKWEDRDALFTGWMLLSYGKSANASSQLEDLGAAAVTDENPRTFWVAATREPGETLTVDLGRAYAVRAVQVNFTDYQSGIFETDETIYTQFRLHASVDGKRWSEIADLTKEKRDRPNAYLELAEVVRARFIRYEHVYVGSPHLAISDLRVFGNGDGKPPATPRGLAARRDSDPRNAFLAWKPVRGAVGYNIRWGVAPAKLYQTYQVWADAGSELEIRALNVGQDYWFAIESFDENGVSRLSEPVHVP